jgi:hypothetical protein
MQVTPEKHGAFDTENHMDNVTFVLKSSGKKDPQIFSLLWRDAGAKDTCYFMSATRIGKIESFMIGNWTFMNPSFQELSLSLSEGLHVLHAPESQCRSLIIQECQVDQILSSLP